MSADQGWVLALDFDGVLWDSAGECFEIGCLAYKALCGRDLSTPQYRERFLLGRPLARTGHDFYLILKLLEEDPTLDLRDFPLQRFVELRTKEADQTQEFDKLFYALRAEYRDNQSDLWMSWQGPYKDLMRLLDRWEDRFLGAALATTKDGPSARSLMLSAGRDWPIFGKEFSVDKAQQIQGIADHFQVAPSSILFVDDLLENLQQVAPTGARTALASWGYNTPDSREEALGLGFAVVDVPALEKLFAGVMGRLIA